MREPLARHPEGMVAEQSVRFSPGTRAVLGGGRIRGTADSLGAAYSLKLQWQRVKDFVARVLGRDGGDDASP